MKYVITWYEYVDKSYMCFYNASFAFRGPLTRSYRIFIGLMLRDSESTVNEIRIVFAKSIVLIDRLVFPSSR